MRHRLLEQKTTSQENGFTIIELLIAITVFSVVLLAVIFALVSFFTTYYKASLSSSTQNDVQNISTSIEQAVKFGVSAPVPPTPPAGSTPGFFCAGNDEFLYFLGKEQPSELPVGYTSALYEIPLPGGSCTLLGATETNGVSLLGSNYRIISLGLTNLSGSYASDWALDIKIAYTSGGANYGDDLLCDPSIGFNLTGGCSPTAVGLSTFTAPDIICKADAGSQFCDVSELKSIVEWRL